MKNLVRMLLVATVVMTVSFANAQNGTGTGKTTAKTEMKKKPMHKKSTGKKMTNETKGSKTMPPK